MLRTLGTVAPGAETRVDGPDPAGSTERSQMQLHIEAGRVALEDREIVGGRLDGDNPGRRHPQREVDGRGADIGACIDDQRLLALRRPARDQRQNLGCRGPLVEGVLMLAEHLLDDPLVGRARAKEELPVGQAQACKRQAVHLGQVVLHARNGTTKVRRWLGHVPQCQLLPWTCVGTASMLRTVPEYQSYRVIAASASTPIRTQCAYY